MIYAMILVVIIGVGSIMFRKVYKDYTKANDEYDSMAMEQQLQMIDLSDVDILKQKAEEAQTYYNENQNVIKQYQPADVVDVDNWSVLLENE